MEQLQTNTVVIGGGPGGYAAAIRLGQLGIKTILVELHKVGGTCLNVGCISSKALLHASATYKTISKEALQMGIEAKGSKINWKKTIEWKDDLVRNIVGGVESLLKMNQVKVLFGKGKIVTPTQIEVDNQVKIQCKNIILATGSGILELPAFPFNHKTILDSTDLLDMKKVPNSMIILGGGIIGMELGTVYASLGCKTTVIEMANRILLNCEKEAAKLVHNSFVAMKGTILTGAKAFGYKDLKKGIELFYKENQKTNQIVADLLAVAVGRIPNINGLILENIHVDRKGKQIIVNDQFQTATPNVYAIGDLIDGPMLAHKATAEGVMTAEIIAGKKASRQDIRIIPDVVYTKPEVANAGMNEEEAKAEGIEVKIGKFPFKALGRAKTTNETLGYIKYVAQASDDRIIGVTIVSSKASELISEAALAIEMRAVLEDVALTIHPHPSFGESHMEVAAAALKKAIHIFNK